MVHYSDHYAEEHRKRSVRLLTTTNQQLELLGQAVRLLPFKPEEPVDQALQMHLVSAVGLLEARAARLIADLTPSSSSSDGS